MTSLSSLQSGNVIINTGWFFNRPSVKVLPDRGNEGYSRIYVTVIPGETTAEQLQSLLKQLNIKYVEFDNLKRIAGDNNVFDRTELGDLDLYLEQKRTLTVLSESGVTIDESSDSYLTADNKIEDKYYINSLIYLQRSGVKVDGPMIESLSLDKVHTQNYIQGLIDLQRAGVSVDRFLVDDLTIEKIKSGNYFQALLELQGAGIQIYSIVEYLSIEKANDRAYINVLKYLHGAGKEVDGAFIREFSLEKSKSYAYVHSLTELQGGGIRVSFNVINKLTLEKGEDRKYVQTLLYIQKAGGEVNGDVINDITLKMSANKNEISIYIQKRKAMLKSERIASEKLWENLSYEKFILFSDSLKKAYEAKEMGEDLMKSIKDEKFKKKFHRRKKWLYKYYQQ
jgi:hypothetical protein